MRKTRRAMKTAVTSPHAHPDTGRFPATRQSIPGVLVLSLLREPVYISGSAHQFLAELSGVPRASWADSDPLPLPVHAVCDELEQSGKRDWEKRQVHLLSYKAQHTVLVRGYGVADGQSSRFLILLSVNLPESGAQAPAPDCRFTERQRAILDGLVRGQTNKEIAASMLISVHTVKEYVRHLMMKLETHSRTGIVARVAGLASPAQPGSPSRPRAGGSQAIQVA